MGGNKHLVSEISATVFVIRSILYAEKGLKISFPEKHMLLLWYCKIEVTQQMKCRMTNIHCFVFTISSTRTPTGTEKYRKRTVFKENRI